MTDLRLRTRGTLRGAAFVGALAVLASLASVPAEARAGGGFSFGSRGARTFSMPPVTRTAPRSAFPMQRTETPSFGTSGSSFAQPRRFGFGSGLAAGLLGAGLLGMLTGHGFFGGLGGMMSLFGLLIQITLIAVAIRFAIGLFRQRSPAYAGAPGPRPGFGGLGGLGAGQRMSELEIGQTDYAAFERLLSDMQYAYSREDLPALARLATAEMVRHLGADIEANRARGLRNDMSDVRLLQGDLAEAWREGSVDYTTVAMRFAARDVMIERQTGRIVSGDAGRPVEATELWTFSREAGVAWRLSGIQQSK